jgi:hypothetical protein
VLYDRLEDQRLFYSGVVRAESCLRGCMEVEMVGSGGKSRVDGGHENFG